MRHAVAMFILSAIMLGANNACAQPTERDIGVTTNTGVLHGTLTFDGSKPGLPAILLISGSGGTDRNGNAQGMHSDTLRLLARDLALKRITSVRFDKRGVGESAPALTNEADLRFQTYVDDARSWIGKLLDTTKARCVWLAGHSEGALIAEIAASGNNRICGLILLAGPGHRGGDLLRMQLSGLLQEPLRDAALKIVDGLEAGRLQPDTPKQLSAFFRPSVQPYLISWLALDPSAILHELKFPTLVIQGSNDIQVPASEAQLLASGRPDAQVLIIPDMNHVLKIAPSDRAGNLATYADPSLPLAPGLTDEIASFISLH